MATRFIKFSFSGICAFIADNWPAGEVPVGEVDVLLLDVSASGVEEKCRHWPYLLFTEHDGSQYQLQKVELENGTKSTSVVSVPRLGKPTRIDGLLPLAGKRIAFKLDSVGETELMPPAGGVEKLPEFDNILDVNWLSGEMLGISSLADLKWREENRVEGIVASRMRLNAGVLGTEAPPVKAAMVKIGEGVKSAIKIGPVDFLPSVYWKIPVGGLVKKLVIEVYGASGLEERLYFDTGSAGIDGPEFAISNICGASIQDIADNTSALASDLAAFYELTPNPIGLKERPAALRAGGVKSGTDWCPPAKMSWSTL